MSVLYTPQAAFGVQYIDGDMGQELKQAIEAGDRLGLGDATSFEGSAGPYTDDYYETRPSLYARPTSSFKVAHLKQAMTRRSSFLC